MSKHVLITGVCALLSTTPVLAQVPSTTPEQRFFEWTALPFAATEYRLRRQALTARLQQSGGGVFLAPSADGATSGGTFRQENDFLYLTGLELPQSIVVLDADRARTILFAPARDARFASASRPNDFPGRPLADDPTLASTAEIDDIRTIDQLEPFLARLADEGRVARVNLGRAGAVSIPGATPVSDWDVVTGLLHYLATTYPTLAVANAYGAVAGVRMVKSDAEIEVLRRAAGITAAAIMSAARAIGPGMDERGLEAEFEAGCKRAGSQRLAFGSIIKSGPNSLWPWRILAAHYDRRNRTMTPDDLVIFDVGCELDYYASDVGRTFPVSGEFARDERELVQIVTSVSDAIIAAVRPGMTFADLRRVADEAIPDSQRRYMQAALFFGHHVGLAVGDPNLEDALLEPGMVFTVEPWYYNHDRNLAVFIEDMILVTRDGADVLTSALPRAPEDLERLVGPGGR